MGSRTADTKRLDLAWVEGLRKDFLTLTKNLPKIHDYQTAHQVREAFRIYRDNFNKLFFDHFLNHDLKNNHPGISDSDAKWFDKKLRGPAWDFSSELSLPIGMADDYHSEASRFNQFEQEAPKWKARAQRKALVFWKEMKDFLDYYQRVHNDSGIDVYVPTVEKTTLEGFQLVMKGFQSNDEFNERELEIFKEGLRIYRRRAGSAAPILLKKQLPVICEFKSTLDKGGEYNHSGYITFYMSSLLGKGPPWVVHVMAHEMGHHLWRTFLSGETRDFWLQTIKGDFGDINLKELLDKWPGDAWAFDFSKELKDDPILALQVEAWTHGGNPGDKGPQTKADFQKLYDSGERTLRVPKTPITGYANKNPEEAFCEAIGVLVAYGPSALHERVRWWLDTALSGQLKLATAERVAARWQGKKDDLS